MLCCKTNNEVFPVSSRATYFFLQALASSLKALNLISLSCPADNNKSPVVKNCKKNYDRRRQNGITEPIDCVPTRMNARFQQQNNGKYC